MPDKRPRRHPNGFLPIKLIESGDLAWNLSLCECGAPMDFRALRCKKCYLDTRRAKHEKFCAGCDKILPINQFYHRSNGGFVARCKKCCADEQRSKSRTPQRIAICVRSRAKRLKNDTQYRIRFMLSNGIRYAIKMQRGRKAFKTETLLGCSVQEFRQHIESQWQSGMNWENWGRTRGSWQLDHKRPLSSFDLSDPLQQRVCFHFTNYQPLWQPDNIRKGAKYDLLSSKISIAA